MAPGVLYENETGGDSGHQGMAVTEFGIFLGLQGIAPNDEYMSNSAGPDGCGLNSEALQGRVVSCRGGSSSTVFSHVKTHQ